MSGDARPVAPLRVALGEYDIGWHDPARSLTRAADLAARAAAAGARLLVLPEMCTTGFTMESEQQAEPLGGPSVHRLGEIASANGLWIIAGVAVRPDHADGCQNAAIVFAPSGEIAGIYYKQRLFAYGGEHRSYAPGHEPLVLTIEGVRVSPFVCYDLRFPELFRRVANDVDLLVLIANWPTARRTHWDVLVRARAIENLCYVVAVNRTGSGGGIDYEGGSVAYGPWGDLLASSAGAGSGIATVDIDPAEVERVRGKYPFLCDMAPGEIVAG